MITQGVSSFATSNSNLLSYELPLLALQLHTLSMSAGIYPLPPVLVADVAECLDTEGLLNLRLSSRYLRDCSLSTFTRRYFHHRRHLATLESLECLLAISRHANFGSAIHTIEISNFSGIVSSISRRRPERALAERRLIYVSELITPYLTEVFKDAINCETVIVGSRDEDYWRRITLVEDYDSDRMENCLSLETRRCLVAALPKSGTPMPSLELDLTEPGDGSAFEFPDRTDISV